MPADIGEKADGFGVAELEWLAIFLSVGEWSCAAEQRHCFSEEPSGGDTGADEITRGIAEENLANKVGFARRSETFCQRQQFPLLKSTLGRIVWGTGMFSS